MSSRETAGATGPSLAQDWLSALRYWLRGRNGVIAMVVLAVVIGAVLNWSWLVAGGVVPFLLTVLPCAVMCGLGLCMNKMAGGSCSTSSNAGGQPGAPPNATQRITAASPPGGKQAPVSVPPEASALPNHSTVGAL